MPDKDSRRQSTKIPKNWPQNIRYLSQNEWSREVPSDILSYYLPRCSWNKLKCSSSSRSPITSTKFPMKSGLNPPGPSRVVRIVRISSPTHPANGQLGLVAAANLSPRSHILDYVGCVHTASTASTSSDYILSLDRITQLSVDAELAGNEGRCINDFRGVAEKPNVEFETYRCEKTGEVRVGVWVLTKKIAKGEELLVTYGKGFWKERRLIA
ncbi:uncharacterized protein SPPG_06881 [Spizellomyces punctatus DAOM BR117]|uniref:SET domain-containing protein n=1 Tax=Spizellomyces punctatus (strain DAOM BR117) TaxID=645134 RepID=A0A0L0H8N1_SPIPD|nr:uncharacterized protein SPPG_06881 [Spizellomyces punctatus DAOM BR117]KNC97890.1 hypothetical protein SPPG_06881 [Spizellomyces punctatus DAOM BR117]|eukprot:XP_016605930.1 hypothetical protein SPPG_06881 [Spizellomyces punctatus DAOM BR117]